MAKKEKVKAKEKHIHKWEVNTEEERAMCICPGECQCKPLYSVVAKCSGCKVVVDVYEIEEVLNKFYK